MATICNNMFVENPCNITDNKKVALKVNFYLSTGTTYLDLIIKVYSQ